MGLSFDKMLIILLIAVFIVGPEKLPLYAQRLGQLVKNLKNLSENAKGRIREEMGEEFDQVDWKKLDPRQYDPRKIIQDALNESSGERAPQGRQGRPDRSGVSSGASQGKSVRSESVFRYDTEAT